MKYSLEVKNVTKVIGNNLIIDDVSFNLERGKIYGLVGANGSGKSTLLKILLGLYNFKGDVIINGFNIRTNFQDVLENIGGIVDFVSFYEYLTAYENLRYFALLFGVDLNRVEEVMLVVKLNKDNKPVKKYSLGMKQRLGIAIALLKNPNILILDEPTNGLDPKGNKELRELLLSFRDKTIIVSSHIISEIEKFVDEVIFINNKKIIQKSIDREEGKSKITLKLGDYDKASDILSIPNLNEKSAVYMSEKEIANNVHKLSKANVPIYRIQDSSSLEDMLISMMEDDNND